VTVPVVAQKNWAALPHSRRALLVRKKPTILVVVTAVLNPSRPVHRRTQPLAPLEQLRVLEYPPAAKRHSVRAKTTLRNCSPGEVAAMAECSPPATNPAGVVARQRTVAAWQSARYQ